MSKHVHNTHTLSLRDLGLSHDQQVARHREQAQTVVAAALASGSFGTEDAANLFNAYLDECHQRSDAQLAKRKQPLACGAGCAHCCTLYLEITFDEALNLRKHLAQLPLRQKSIIRARNLLNAIRIEAGKAQDSPKNYHRLELSCMFLTESATCAIHPIRPLACRHHHSFNVQQCKTRDSAVQNKERLAAGYGVLHAKEDLLKPRCEAHPEFTRWKGELHTMLRKLMAEPQAPEPPVPDEETCDEVVS